MNKVRLVQLVAFAAFCLLALKSMGLLLGGGYVLSGSAPAQASAPVWPEDFSLPPSEGDAPSGSAPAKDQAAKGEIDVGGKNSVDGAKGSTRKDKGQDKDEPSWAE